MAYGDRVTRPALPVRRVPQRQCVGCGRRGPQAELVRFHLERSGDAAYVVADRSVRTEGRGAYLCPSRRCLDTAVQRKAFQRAFRAPAGVDVEELAEVLAKAVA